MAKKKKGEIEEGRKLKKGQKIPKGNGEALYRELGAAKKKNRACSLK